MKTWSGWIVSFILLLVVIWQARRRSMQAGIAQVEVDADVTFAEKGGPWLHVNLKVSKEQADKAHTIESAGYWTGNDPTLRPDRLDQKTVGDPILMDETADHKSFFATNVMSEYSIPDPKSVRWIFVKMSCSCGQPHYAAYEWMAPESRFQGTHDLFEVVRR